MKICNSKMHDEISRYKAFMFCLLCEEGEIAICENKPREYE